jgi:hypothetical protein
MGASNNTTRLARTDRHFAVARTNRPFTGQVASLSTFWITRDRYENPLSYSIWSIEPALDRDGHWARLDPKRTGTDVRQICSARVAEAVLGRTLQLGQKIGPIVGAFNPTQGREQPTQTPKTQ